MRSNEPFRFRPGKKLGRHYRVVDFLGDGWEGEVYKVEETSTNIIRAAKLFYKHRYVKKQSPLVHYAKKLHRLRTCPIVMQYHHQDSCKQKNESLDFLVSDFIDGEVLSKYLSRQPQKRLAPFEALHLFYALIKGVEQIHALGEYHGDIHLENIIVRKMGLQFEVHLIDLLHLGKPNKKQMQHDICDLIEVFYEIIGGAKHYRTMPKIIKKIILGKRYALIEKKFKSAEQLRVYLESLS